MSSDNELLNTQSRIASLIGALQRQLPAPEPPGLMPSLSELLALDRLSACSLTIVLKKLEEFERQSQQQPFTSSDLPVLAMSIRQELDLRGETRRSHELADTDERVSDVEDGIHWLPVSEFVGGPFAFLPGRMQHELRHRMASHLFRDRETLFEEGTAGDCLWLITAGTVGIWSRQLRQRIGSVRGGEVLGEMALMGVPQRTADAVAEGEVTALRLSSDDFFELCQRYPQIAHVLTNVIADRLGTDRHDAFSEKTLGGYRIRQRLGRGGMAIVYDAVHLAEGRRVALKMMSHRLVFDQLASAWFRREAATISRFNHPHIPRLIECFDGFGTIFMAMDFIEGETLAEILARNGPFSENETLRILHQLAQALQYAHQNGIVHRDVKPGNVMITPTGQVMLMDFGLSIPWKQPDDRTPVAGTLSYMSPEQFYGDAVDPASDWFGFGCVAFELITGRRLVSARMAADLYDIFELWNVDEILEDFPGHAPRVRTIIARCLQLDPARRTGIAESLAEFMAPPVESATIAPVPGSGH